MAKPIGNDRWPKPTGGALNLLTVVIPARDEAENVESAVDHLHHESPENWPAHRHRELSHWRQKSDGPAFIARLDALVSEGRADSIFLAADLPETYDLFAGRYGDRVAMLRRDLYDRSVRQLQYALADLILLTAVQCSPESFRGAASLALLI